MSKINIEFDTQTKLLDAKLDGKTISNLSKIEFYCYNMEDGCMAMVELETSELDEEQKMYKMTKICAEDSSELIDKQKPLHEEIVELLNKTNK
jgi:hypothetical protein